MRRCQLKKNVFGNNVKIRVRGSQGGLQGPTGGSLPVMTPGSSMNSRAHAPVLSVSVLSRAIFSVARAEVVRTGAAVLLAAVLLAIAAPARLPAQSANTLYKRGQAAEARQDFDAAFDLYQKANAKNPRDITYRSALFRVRTSAAGVHVTNGRKLAQAGNNDGALAEFLHAAALDPSNEAAQQEIARLQAKSGKVAQQTESSIPQAEGEQEEVDNMGAPIVLKPLSNEPLTLHMTEDAKVIYEAVGKAAGVNVMFDPDYNSKRIQVDLNNVSLMDALRIVGTMSNTFWHPITSNTIFVAQNTRIKRTELDSQAVQTFYLSNAWQQNDLNDVQTALRNVITNGKFFGVASQNAIVMRGTPDEILLAQKIINDLDKARAEVVVDIAVMEVSKNWERNLGIAWPGSFGVALNPPCSSSSSTDCSSSSSSTTVTPTLYDLAHLSSSNFAVTVGSATLNLLLTNSNTKVLQSPRIRATDAQKAVMKIGSRIPIATGSYQTGAATAVVSSLVNTQFQYQDVGVQIEMTPTVHYDHEVTLKIKIEVTSHSGDVTISGVTQPIISQRVVDHVIRLREGEASLLGGIQSNQDSQNASGIPGLSALPILRYVFGNRDHSTADDDIVFVVVPHIVRSQDLNQANLRPVDTGSGQSIDLRLLGDTSGSTAANTPPAVRPAVLQTQGTTVSSASAEAAAPAMLAQLNGAAQNASTPPPMRQVTAPAQTAPAPVPAAANTQAAAQAAPGTASFVISTPAGPQASGSTFQVPVVLNSAADVASVPIQIQYDPAKLSLVNVAAGDLLNRDGQAVALIHRDDGPGNVTVVASRPPGTAGITGSGSVCVLTFQAKTAGATSLTMTRASAVDSKQQPVNMPPAQANVVIQ
jgi:general secretion pathway protein D